MPPSNGADGLLAGVALRNDRDLDLGWPISALARTGEDLEPLNPLVPALSHDIVIALTTSASSKAVKLG